MLWGHRTTTSRSWGILVPSVFRQADTRRLFQQTPRHEDTLPNRSVTLKGNRLVALWLSLARRIGAAGSSVLDMQPHLRPRGCATDACLCGDKRPVSDRILGGRVQGVSLLHRMEETHTLTVGHCSQASAHRRPHLTLYAEVPEKSRPLHSLNCVNPSRSENNYFLPSPQALSPQK